MTRSRRGLLTAFLGVLFIVNLCGAKSIGLKDVLRTLDMDGKDHDSDHAHHSGIDVDREEQSGYKGDNKGDDSYERRKFDKYDSKRGNFKSKKAFPSENCREYINEDIQSAEECAFYRPRASVPSTLDFTIIAKCRWDNKINQGSCLCPRTESLCYSKKLRGKCYWHGESRSRSSYGDDDDEDKETKGVCISNAEKFYIVLGKLLLKRGKKDFAVRINYSSSPAKGKLPYGPNGPAIVDYGPFSRFGGAPQNWKGGYLGNLAGWGVGGPIAPSFFNRNKPFNKPLSQVYGPLNEETTDWMKNAAFQRGYTDGMDWNPPSHGYYFGQPRQTPFGQGLIRGPFNNLGFGGGPSFDQRYEQPFNGDYGFLQRPPVNFVDQGRFSRTEDDDVSQPIFGNYPEPFQFVDNNRPFQGIPFVQTNEQRFNFNREQPFLQPIVDQFNYETTSFNQPSPFQNDQSFLGSARQQDSVVTLVHPQGYAFSPVQGPIQQAPLVQAPFQQGPIQGPIQQAPLLQEPYQQGPIKQVSILQEPFRQAPIHQEAFQQAPIHQEAFQQAPIEQPPFLVNQFDPNFHSSPDGFSRSTTDQTTQYVPLQAQYPGINRADYNLNQ